MELQDFLDHVNSGAPIEGGSPQHRFMHVAAQEAFRTTAEINTGDRSPGQIRTLMSRLTGRTVDASVTVFPPFYTEFGKNLRLGKNVFINGESFAIKRADKAALETLANERKLDGAFLSDQHGIEKLLG